MEKYKKCHSTLYAARIQDDCLPLEARSLIGSSGIHGYVARWLAEAPLSQKRIESWQPCPLEIDLDYLMPKMTLAASFVGSAFSVRLYPAKYD